MPLPRDYASGAARAYASGVLGSAGRTRSDQPNVIHTADLHVGGRRVPLVGPARVYVCGITPYDVTHLGHAATFVWADAAAAVMRLTGVEPLICRNVTDVDDVLTRSAGARGRHYDEFALNQEYLFGRDMAALRVRRPAYEPRARHHVTGVQQLAAALLATDHAYEREGHVYFRGAWVADGAGLAREEALRRCAEYGDTPEDPLREDPLDVPVWRPSSEEHPAWPSPWGWGRPGWHAECAAMALAAFGAHVDLLAGGADLTFPHHAYQSAMVEAATGTSPFARAQLHVGAVHQDGAKMAKSTGNLTLVADLLREHAPAALRVLLLDRHWDEPWDYEPGLLDTAADTLDLLYASAARPTGSAAAEGAVRTALLSDLDVPAALRVALDAGGETARGLIATLDLG